MVENALDALKQALQLDAHNYWAALGAGNIYLYDLEDYELAHHYLETALSIDPRQPNTFLSLGDLFRNQGDLPKAVVSYEQALIRKPDWQLVKDRLKALRDHQR